MRHWKPLGSEIASRLFCVPEKAEQQSAKAIAASAGGIFVGHSHTYSIPFFLDFESLINPHVFILGMSGGGKTFLMGNLLLKVRATIESKLIIIDFTGEYSGAVELQAHEERDALDPLSYINEEGHRILYFNLKGLQEREKIEAAAGILREVVKAMRSMEVDAKGRIFILLDEAWKLLGTNADLEVIIREGRKYKVGLMMASQLIEDIELPMLSSSAALFIFKVQNKESLDGLSRNYNLGEKYIEAIQNLDVGSCLAIQVLKTGKREAFVIRRVMGVSMKRYLAIMLGGIMMEVEEEELAAAIRRLCKEDSSVLISEISADRSIELHSLIKRLLILGADRKAVLDSLRKFGADDYGISDAFALAIAEIGDTNAE